MSEVLLQRPPRWSDRLLDRFSGKRIELNGQPYLTRYYVWGDGQGKGLEVYLHHLHRPDDYRHLHNHPWRWFFSIVLKGFYRQSVLLPPRSNEQRVQKIRMFNFFRGYERYHEIQEVAEGGTWTLVIVPKKRSEDEERWGYWNETTNSHEPDTRNANPNCRTIRFGPKRTFN